MTLANVIRSEWIKLASVRSTWWTVGTCYLVTVGVGAAALAAVNASDETIGLDFVPIEVGLIGLAFGQLAMAVTGVLVISSEYTSGAIRTSLTAVPQRLRLFAAKAIVLSGFALAAGLLIAVSCFLLTQVFFSGEDSASLGHDGVARATLGGALYLAASALLSFGIGGIIRNTGGGITVAVAALFVLPLMFYGIPGVIGNDIAPYVTTNAGAQITFITGDDGIGAWPGFLVYLVWTAIAVGLAATILQRRDA